MSSTLLICANADAVIGTGHVMRCLALAQTWRRGGGRIVFLQAATTPAIVRRLQSEDCEQISFDGQPGGREDFAETIRAAKACQADWIVGDSYHFDAVWQNQIKEAGFRLLLLDDFGHSSHYHADIILNQSARANPGLYAQRNASARLLLGSDYALIRREFLIEKHRPRTLTRPASRLLVTLGGSDPGNVTLKIVSSLAGLPLQAKVVIGGSNPQGEAICKSLKEFSGTPLKLETITDAQNMPALMSWADLAISAGGSTCLELAYMGLPAVVVVTASNQLDSAEALARAGAAVNLGPVESLPENRILQTIDGLRTNLGTLGRMSESGRTFVDGLGAQRVMAEMKALSLNLYDVQERDYRELWEWRNDPQTREASFNPSPVSWEDHISWCRKREEDSGCLFWLARTNEGRSLGQVRFDRTEPPSAVVSISIAPKMRGQGWAAALLKKACQRCFEAWPIQEIVALIKPDNHTSIKTFSLAGFRTAGTRKVGKDTARQYVLPKN